MEFERPILWKNNKFVAEIYDDNYKKYSSQNNKRMADSYDRTPSIEVAEEQLAYYRESKFNVLAYVLGGGLKGILIVLIPVIALVGAFMGTGVTVLPVIAYALVVLALTIGMIVGLKTYVDDSSFNRRNLCEYERYVDEYTENLNKMGARK